MNQHPYIRHMPKPYNQRVGCLAPMIAIAICALAGAFMISCGVILYCIFR